MVTTNMPTTATRFPRRALIGVGLLLAAELGVIGTVFKHSINFTCLDNWPAQACAGASGALVSLYCVAAALTLMAMLIPAPFRRLAEKAGVALWPLALNGAGVLIIFLPLLFMKQGAGTAVLLPAFACWSIGMVMLLAGLARLIAPLAHWRAFVTGNLANLILVLAAGLAAPWLAAEIRPLWRLETIADITFTAVAKIIGFVGYEVESFTETKVIGAGDFYISVAPQCSGVEGFALVTLFVTLYLWLFRADLRFPVALLLYPLGLMASAFFNVLRIAVLLAIGLEGNPELAVGGFHSHAGWLMFTLVALGIIALAQTVPGLRKTSAPRGPAPLPLTQDPVVAKILPFAVFMFSALLVQVFAQSPGVVYPLRVMAMGAVLALFWPLLARLPWRLDPVAVAAGFAIGLIWVAIPVPEAAPGDAPYGAFAGMWLLAWFVMRGIGTIVFVPIIEELFFRDYLETLLRRHDTRAWRIAAALATAALFAALHDRWAEAFLAGLVFSWVMARRGTVVDAIIAHATANALVFSVALTTGNLNII